jgi:catechol 2,3-dioxygenase-like lactoylglutathione lyase family enzyme
MVAGLKGLDHVGVSVRSLELSLQFYERVLGITPECIFEASGPDLANGVGVPGAHLRAAMLRVGSTRIELLEYRNPRGKPFRIHNNDVGSPHICLQVADITVAWEELSAKGAKFSSRPLQIYEGPLAGCSWCYFVDPDGVTLELFERHAKSSRGGSQGELRMTPQPVTPGAMPSTDRSRN